jgi:phage terminase small subunit
MNASDVQSLVATVDGLIFSHTGEHLDDLQQAILEGAFNHQKYAEIAKNNYRSEKYVKDVAGKLWKTLSTALGEEIGKSNIKSSLQRYYYSNFSNVVNSVQINRGNICTGLPESELKQSSLDQEIKLKIVTELIKEGLTIEQIARVLKLPLELVKEYIQQAE